MKVLRDHTLKQMQTEWFGSGLIKGAEITKDYTRLLDELFISVESYMHVLIEEAKVELAQILDEYRTKAEKDLQDIMGKFETELLEKQKGAEALHGLLFKDD